jgi:hypothetical protein
VAPSSRSREAAAIMPRASSDDRARALVCAFRVDSRAAPLPALTAAPYNRPMNTGTHAAATADDAYRRHGGVRHA